MMLSTISNFFTTYLSSEVDNKEDIQVDKFQLASAALLIELSKADQTIDESETEAMLIILKKKFALPDDALEELITLAHQESDESTSLYQFTTLINDEFTYSEKARLIRNMWEIAFADGNLDHYEEHLIRKVADLLYITHSDFIKSKLRVKNSL